MTNINNFKRSMLMKYFELETEELTLEYENHLKNLAPKYPKKLYDLFIKHERFHDYYIKKLSLDFENIIFKNQHTKIYLTIISDFVGDEVYLEFEFDKIVKFYIDSDHYCKYGDYFLHSIYYTEIGITQDGNFSFELAISDGPKIYFEFGKCKVLKQGKPKMIL